MKKFIFFSLLLVSLAACGQSENKALTSQDLRTCILTNDNKPTENLKELLKIFNIEHNNTFEDIAKKVHTLWPYPSPDLIAGIDTYDFKPYEAKKPELRPLFEKLGLINPIKDTNQKKYMYAFVPSGWVGVTFCRLALLKELWRKGIRFEKIVILTGQRDLTTGDWESDKNITIDKTRPCKTEYELTKAVFSSFDLPEDMKKLPVIFVNTPKQKTEAGTLREPYPEDQLLYWLETNPEPGDCLAATNQAYVRILENIFRNTLPKTFKNIDAVGYAHHQKYETVQRWMYALAWLLHEEQLRVEKSQEL
ncbi:MAG: hypothetical protein ABH827_00140 [bacterium]